MTATLFDTPRSAWISTDRRHRFTLERRWKPGGRPLVWVMLNPSTADTAADDPTIRRITRFTRDHGHNALLVVNLYTLRAADPAVMLATPDRVTRGADAVLAMAAAQGPMVAAWGTRAEPGRVADVLGDPLAGVDLLCLGTTKDGHPRHPLYVPAAQPLEPYQRTAP